MLSSGGGDRSGLVEKDGLCLLSDGRYSKAKRCFKPVMEARKREPGEKHPLTLTSMANLASTYWNQGDGRKLSS